MHPEYLIERKKIKKQLNMWKFIAVILIAIVMTFATRSFVSGKGNKLFLQNSKSQEYIASIYIDGMILDDKKRDESLRNIAEEANIKGVIVYINSPGGTVGGSEELYNMIRKIAQKKPTTVVMQSVAASGGYLVSLAADYIIAHNSTLTGSLGVLFQSAEVTTLAEKLGVTFNNFKSSPLKAAPNPLEKVTPEIEEAIMSAVNDSYNYFVEIIAARRKLPREYIMQIADGRVYTGRQAFELKLVDKIGSTDDAIKWLQEEKKLPNSLKVIEYQLKPQSILETIIGADVEQKLYGLFGSGGRLFF